ncbi:MAG: CDP-diacylglycerol--glycerol-3-phosphate 3-phosphatidyltransferase [Clostridia bacterium]|nr:CDP-diacylglycerol--glycerol-3-phosphate 3-phosphatidyltransferase [Clostridia bacterium]
MKKFRTELIPNYLSLFRILLIPLFIYLFLFYQNDGMLWGGVVFILAGITDIIDGYLARRNNWITNIGKLLDPLADKLMQIAAISCLYIKSLIPFWLILTIVVKELVMIAGATLILKRGRIYVHSNWYGKMGTTVFYAVVLTIIITKGNYPVVSNLLSVLLLLLTLFTFFMYYIKTYRGEYKKKRLQNQNNQKG